MPGGKTGSICRKSKKWRKLAVTKAPDYNDSSWLHFLGGGGVSSPLLLDWRSVLALHRFICRSDKSEGGESKRMKQGRCSRFPNMMELLGWLKAGRMRWGWDGMGWDGWDRNLLSPCIESNICLRQDMSFTRTP